MTNHERRKAHEQDMKREQEIKRAALLSAIESGELTASEKVQAVKMLNDLKDGNHRHNKGRQTPRVL